VTVSCPSASSANCSVKVDLSVTEGGKSLATKKVSFQAPKKKRK
jgi:hypothetical protein